MTLSPAKLERHSNYTAAPMASSVLWDMLDKAESCHARNPQSGGKTMSGETAKRYWIYDENTIGVMFEIGGAVATMFNDMKHGNLVIQRTAWYGDEEYAIGAHEMWMDGQAEDYNVCSRYEHDDCSVTLFSWLPYRYLSFGRLGLLSVAPNLHNVQDDLLNGFIIDALANWIPVTLNCVPGDVTKTIEQQLFDYL